MYEKQSDHGWINYFRKIKEELCMKMCCRGQSIGLLLFSCQKRKRAAHSRLIAHVEIILRSKEKKCENKKD